MPEKKPSATYGPRKAPRGPRPESVKAAISESLRGRRIVRSPEFKARVGTTKSLGRRGIDCTEATWDTAYEERLVRFRVISKALEEAGL